MYHIGLLLFSFASIVHAQDNSTSDGFRLASRFTSTPLPALPLLMINQTIYIYGEQTNNRSIAVFRQPTAELSYPSLPSSTFPRLRGHTAHVVSPDSILLCFGFNGDSFSDGLFEWRVSGNAMDKIQTAPSPTPATRVGHASVWDSTRSRLWVWGGMGGNTMTALPELWMLDYSNKTWSLMPALESRVLSASTSEPDTLMGVLGSSMVLIGNTLVICGGINDVYVSRACVLFDTSTLTWWPTPRTNPDAMKIPARAYGTLLRTSENGATLIGGFITVDDFQSAGANSSSVNPWLLTVDTSPRSINWRIAQLSAGNSSLLTNIAQDTLYGSQEDGSVVAYSPSVTSNPLVSMNATQTGLQLLSYVPVNRPLGSPRPANNSISKPSSTPGTATTSSSQSSDPPSGGRKDLVMVLNVGVALCVLGLVVLGVFIYRRNREQKKEQEFLEEEGPFRQSSKMTEKKGFVFHTSSLPPSLAFPPTDPSRDRLTPSVERTSTFLPIPGVIPRPDSTRTLTPPTQTDTSSDSDDDEDDKPLFLSHQNIARAISPKSAAKPTRSISPPTSFLVPPPPALTRIDLDFDSDRWSMQSDPKLTNGKPGAVQAGPVKTSTADMKLSSLDTLKMPAISTTSFLLNDKNMSVKEIDEPQVDTALFLNETLIRSEVFGSKPLPLLTLGNVADQSAPCDSLSLTSASKSPACSEGISNQKSFELKPIKVEMHLVPETFPSDKRAFASPYVSDHERSSSVVDAYAEDVEEDSEDETPLQNTSRPGLIKTVGLEKKNSSIPKLVTSRSISDMLELEPPRKNNISPNSATSGLSDYYDPPKPPVIPVPSNQSHPSTSLRPMTPDAGYSEDEMESPMRSSLALASEDEDEVYVEDKIEKVPNQPNGPTKSKLLSLAMRPGSSPLVHFASSPLRHSVRVSSPESSSNENECGSATSAMSDKRFKLSSPEDIDLSFDFKF